MHTYVTLLTPPLKNKQTKKKKQPHLSLQKVIGEMNRLGMMVDLSYGSDILVRQALKVSRAPVIFSHSAARAVCDNMLNVPDDILQLLVSSHPSPQTQGEACFSQRSLTLNKATSPGLTYL